MTCLCLNITYEPLRVMPTKRAVDLVLQGKASVLEEWEHRVRSSHIDMAAPSVIKLNYLVKIPFKSRIPLNRRTLMARDGGECQFRINGKDCDRVGNTIDHVQPRARGGKHEWTNTVACCGKHNAQKRDRLLSELHGWELKREPQAPSGAQWLVRGIASRADEEAWEGYLASA